MIGIWDIFTSYGCVTHGEKLIITAPNNRLFSVIKINSRINYDRICTGTVHIMNNSHFASYSRIVNIQ